MTYRRGFKAEAERLSEEIRGELNLKPKMSLDVFELAKHLAIPIFGLEDLSKALPGSTFQRYFAFVDTDTFSAITVFNGMRRCIVHNDSHHPNRQSSNIAHELSHSLLEHDPTPLRGADGQRIWNAELEAEATWLGAALLIPREGALSMFQQSLTFQQIATHYGVSEKLCSWRVRESGIVQQTIRARRFFAR